ncbi:hypothetical protein E4T51_06869 [Aureobasidium sp. EXF-12344]|nr:hypothetical protein E4T51_06869 [Aureobasidium sp. EXF-12344]
MPYIIPHVRDLEDSAPRMLIGHRLLPETHPLRRFEEQKRLVYDRDYAYMCLVGMIPPKEQGGRRPERRLPPAPLPPGSRASKVLRKLLPPGVPASGPPSPRSPRNIFRRNAAAGSPKNPVVPVTQEPSAATWNRVFGRIPPRVLKTVPESINNIKMIPHNSNEDDLCLVPLGSENAIPTVRGIIEEYHEEREYEQTEQTSLKEKRTPVYLSPKLAQYTAEAIRKSNLKNHPVSSSARLPPKAHQLLGSPRPTNNNSDSTHVEHVEQTPLHTKGNPTTSLRHSASFRVASLLTPTKARKSSTSSLAQSKVVQHTSSSSHHTTFSHKHTATSSSSSPLKHSSFLSTVSSRNKMSAQPSPTKQATAGAPSNKSASDAAVSPTKSYASPKKEDSSLKRALSNAFTPKRMREDVPPPPPRKDTPPRAHDKSAHLRMSANIIDVRGPSDAYSGNGFAATVEDAEDEAPTNKSRETITVAFGDECSPVKSVKSGVVKMTHAAYSPFVGQKAVFEADPEVVQKIQQEFATPPLDFGLFHSHEVEKKSPKSAQKAMTPRYIAGGLLEGGLLPATTYQPPPKISEKIKPQPEIYSPSMYSVATGNDVFNTGTHGVASEEPEAIPIVPSNSPIYNDEHVNGALARPRVEPIRYICTVNDNDYVYRPEDHVFNRHRGETPVVTHDFATAGAEQKQGSSTKGPVNVDTPANKINGYGGLQFDQYEHPSAKPRPLRRVSRDNSSRSSSGRSLRERFFAADGLGIELSESSNTHVYDNGTTIGVDGDDEHERRREMIAMRSPNSSIKPSPFSYPSLPPKSKERKYKSHPVQSSQAVIDAWNSDPEAKMDYKLDLMGGKVEDLVTAQTSNEKLLTSTQKSVDKILAEQLKIREDMDEIVANHNVFRESFEAVVSDTHTLAAEYRKIRDSVSDIAEHVIDDEMLELLVVKVVKRLLPTISRVEEKVDANFKSVLDILDPPKEGKQKKTKEPVADEHAANQHAANKHVANKHAANKHVANKHVAGQQTPAVAPTNAYTSPVKGVQYAPASNLHFSSGNNNGAFSASANGPFTSSNNELLAPRGGNVRKSKYNYTEDPSER